MRPDPEAQKPGSTSALLGRTQDGKTRFTKVTGDADPGYGSTSKMLGEPGMCLPFDIPPDQAGGFWTPASVLNDKLLERLTSKAGLTFEVVETR